MTHKFRTVISKGTVPETYLKDMADLSKSYCGEPALLMYKECLLSQNNCKRIVNKVFYTTYDPISESRVKCRNLDDRKNECDSSVSYYFYFTCNQKNVNLHSEKRRDKGS